MNLVEGARGIGLALLVGFSTPGPDIKAQFQEPIEIFRGNRERAEFALTFDCGPWVNRDYLTTILDAHDEYGITSTIFVTGQFLEKHGELFKERIASRYEIANHSYSHPHMLTLSAGDQRNELRWTEQLVQNLTEKSSMPYWRAPFGERNPQLVWLAAEEGYPYHVMWAIDSGDWQAWPAETVKKRILDGAENGNVIVAHCNSWQTAAVIRDVFYQLNEWGIKATTVSQILR